jgi:glycosyltransferase involved in cell wall biosynthesis
MKPRVTFLVPFFNAERHLVASVGSMLSQTYADWKALLIDDCSSDSSRQVVESFRDGRIKTIVNERNLGVAAALNRGLELVDTEFIARTDADDVCCPRRLEDQLLFMRDNPDVGAVGAWARFTGGHMNAVDRRPWGGDAVRATLCLDNPIIHPSVMIRKCVLDQHKLRYDPTYSRSEDFDLWSRMSEHAALDNVPEVLLKYRVHGESITSVARVDMDRQRLEILRRELGKIGMEPTEEELIFHGNAGCGKRMTSRTEIEKAEAWFQRLLDANGRTNHNTHDSMKKAVAMTWFKLCSNNGQFGSWIWTRYRNSVLREGGYSPSAGEKARFALSIVWHAVT